MGLNLERGSAEKQGVANRLAKLLPRFVVLTLLGVLTTATLTFAAERRLSATPAQSNVPTTGRPILRVPDVQRQAYVFAKGMLEDAGFAWKVSGSVQGYSANVVAQQTPAAGTRVYDTGAPTIVLRLARGRYPERGLPENTSAFPGTRLRIADSRPVVAAPVAPAKPLKLGRLAKPVKKPVAAPRTAKKAVPARPVAFAVPGAPKEPLKEISLPARAQLLRTWLASHSKPTNANVRHWLYQHAWIVDGADFGWWHGAQALRTLIAVDRTVEARWGIGGRSQAVARAALARVAARSR
jgi:hypothetical protein